MGLDEVFDRIVVINLPDRVDRRRQIASELARLGLRPGAGAVAIFPGVRPEQAEGFPSPGARGCFLSHLGVLREAAAAGAGRLLVMEDDLALPSDFAARFGSVAAEVARGDWSFLYLGHVDPEHARAEGEQRLVESRKDQTCLHMIAVSGRAIADLAAYLESCLGRPPGDPVGGPMHVDGAVNMYRRRHPEARTLLAAPSLGFQRSSRSDIAAPRWYDRAPMLRHGVSVLRDARQRLLRRS